MVDSKIITETLAILKITYPNSLKDITEEEAKLMIQVWANDFKNEKKEDFLKAIENIRYTSKYFPSVSDIKNEIAKLQICDIPKAEDEWELVLKSVRQFGSYRVQEAKNTFKPYTAYIVSHIGYMNICMAEDQTWNKKEFIAEYNQLKDKEIQNIQIGKNERLFISEVSSGE